MQSTSIALHRSDEAKKSLSEKLSATQPSPAGQQEFLGYKSLFSFLWSSFTYLENEILLLAKLRPICECPSIFNNAYHKTHGSSDSCICMNQTFLNFCDSDQLVTLMMNFLFQKVSRNDYSAAIPACLYMKFCIYERPGTFLVKLRTSYAYPCQLNYTKKRVAERMLHTSDKYHGFL